MNNPEGTVTRRTPATLPRWQLGATATEGLIGIFAIGWLVWAGISYSANGDAIAPETKGIEASHAIAERDLLDADRYFIERARALDARIKSAFSFHNPSKGKP